MKLEKSVKVNFKQGILEAAQIRARAEKKTLSKYIEEAVWSKLQSYQTINIKIEKRPKVKTIIPKIRVVKK